MNAQRVRQLDSENRTMAPSFSLTSADVGLAEHVLAGAQGAGKQLGNASRRLAFVNHIAEQRREGAEVVGPSGGWAAAVFGLIIVLLAVPIQWFNEDRSIRLDILSSRGLAEVATVDAKYVSKSNRGRLVHVQGWATGAKPIVDPQFADAQVTRCLKLQSTVEVFEWVQVHRAWREGRERRSQPRFHQEWCTTHHDSRRFSKPSPENPRLPSGLCLGTLTQVCSRVELGAFVLPEEMVHAFRRFEPAARILPPQLSAHGLTFHAHEDGYYYSRPGASSTQVRGLFTEHQVGDIRVRFLCVPETIATVVAVQCHKDGFETFVPYRPIPRSPCTDDWQARQALIEEGDRSSKELRSETACCCTGGMVGCCCCACTTIACLCAQEVITEEICFVSDRPEPPEAPFAGMVQRNPCRVWNFRLLGLLAMFAGIRLGLSPFAPLLVGAPGLSAYGTRAAGTVAAAAALAASAAVLAAAALRYKPTTALQWACAAGLCAVAPLVLGRAHTAV